MVTQKDIAAACGVSTATVSKALGDFPDIGEETKRMVRRTADRMGYGKAAEIKRQRHTNVIGLLATNDAETFFHQAVIIKIRQLLLESGFDLVMLSPKGSYDGSGGLFSGDEPEGMRRKKTDPPGYLSRARLHGLEGIFLFSSIREDQLFRMRQEGDLRELVFSEIPLVAVDCGYMSCTSVIPACAEGARSLLRYICELGHSRIAVVYGGGEEKRKEIEKAVDHTFREMHLRIPRDYMRCVKAECAQDAYEATLSLIRTSEWTRPTCVLYGDDFLLDGGRAAIWSQGYRIPEDFSIAALSFMDSRKTFEDRVTTSWRILPEQIAEKAVDSMLRAIRMPEGGSCGIHRMKGTFFCGETVADLWQQETGTGPLYTDHA